MSYQLLLTDAGAAKVAAAANAGGLIHLTDFVIGQGVNVDFSTRLDKQVLVSKRYQGKIQSVAARSGNPRQYEITCIVPPDVGGFTIREFGLIDDTGVLIWVGSLPEVQKPDATSTAAVDYRIKAVVQVDNPQVSIVIDTNVVTATQSWVNANFASIGHNHQDMLDRLIALEKRIYESVAVGGIYATTKLYGNGNDVHTDLGYGVWALYAQGKVLAGYSTIASDDAKYKIMGNVFEIGSEIESQKAIVAQFWKRLPNDYIAPTFDMYYTSDQAGLNRVTSIGEETPIYLWLDVANATQPIQLISFLSDVSGAIRLTNSSINYPKTVNNGKTLLVSVMPENYIVDSITTLNWGFMLNDPYVDVESAVNAKLTINDTISDAPTPPPSGSIKVHATYPNNAAKYNDYPDYFRNGSITYKRFHYDITENTANLVTEHFDQAGVNDQTPIEHLRITFPDHITDIGQLNIQKTFSAANSSLYGNAINAYKAEPISFDFSASTHTLVLYTTWHDMFATGAQYIDTADIFITF